MQSVLDEIVDIVDNDLPPLEENEEDMGIRKEDWPLIHAELDKRFEAAKPQGIRRVVFWLKEWGAISALWAVPLALLAAVITLGNFTSTRISKEAIFEQKTDDDFKDINQRLTSIQNTLSGVNTVSEVSSALFDAQRNGRKLSTDVLNRLGKSIEQSSIKSPDMGSIWQTASTLISYRYANNGKDQSSSLPNCWDHYIGHFADGIPSPNLPAPPNWLAIDEQRFGNCELTLDDGPQFRGSGFGKAYEKNLIDYPAAKLVLNAHDVVVTYSGGTLIPYYRLLCNRCVFRTAVRGIPTPQGKKVFRDLLVADTDKVELSQSGE